MGVGFEVQVVVEVEVGFGLGLGLGLGFSMVILSHFTLLIFLSKAAGRVSMVIFLLEALRQRGVEVLGHVKSLWMDALVLHIHLTTK